MNTLKQYLDNEEAESAIFIFKDRALHATRNWLQEVENYHNERIYNIVIDELLELLGDKTT